VNQVAPDQRATNEIEHGRLLAAGDTEDTWGWDTPAGRARARRRAQMIVRTAGLRPGVRALEIGCGTGMFTSLFAESGAEIVGVDISGDLLARARERGLPEERVQFVEARFEDYTAGDRFDAVIGSSVLHHLDLDAAVPQIFDLLGSGGRMSFAEPNLLNPQVYLSLRFRSLPMFWYVSPDETAFLRWSLKKRVDIAGFEGVEIVPHEWLHPATPPGWIRMVSAMGRGLERTPGVREFAGSHLITARRP